MEKYWLNPLSRFSALRGFYNDKLELADTRVNGWLLMSSPVPTVTMVALYLLFVIVGPHIMKHRNPVNVKIPMMIYNFLMILLSYYLFHEFLFGMIGAKFTFLCDPVDYSNDPTALRLAVTCWLFFTSKFIEFLDTIFFILRKKNNQVTMLHVYHHSTMPLLWWIWTKWAAGGTSCVPACVNSFVHIVMYTYYFLSGMGPGVQKFLWWKKYITIMQMVQFIGLASHTIIFMCLTDCDYPSGMKTVHVTYMLSLTVLFSNFYMQSYLKKGKKKSTAEPSSGSDIHKKSQ